MYKVKFWTVKKIIAGMLLTIIGMIVGLTYDANAAQVSAFQIDFIDVGQGGCDAGLLRRSPYVGRWWRRSACSSCGELPED